MKRLIKTLALVLGLNTFLFFGVASAHVVVQPSTVGVAEFQTFTVSVPTEKDVPTTNLRLLIPKGVEEVTPTVKTGWDISTKKDDDQVTEINWGNGLLPAGLRDDFTFSAQVPPSPTELHWKAYQTYADGSVVSWDATPTGDDDASGDKGPYSTTKVINDLSPPAQKSSRDTVGYALSAAALAIAVIALIKSRSSGSSSKQ